MGVSTAQAAQRQEMGERAHEASSKCTSVEFTLHSAHGLKNKKYFGNMSPCAVVTVAGTAWSQVSDVAVRGGTHPSFEKTFLFSIPESVLKSENPKPFIRVELFRSSKLKQSLGTVDVPLASAIARYSELCSFTQGVIWNGTFCGTLTYSVLCAAPSFAPPKDSSNYEAFVKWLQAPPPPTHAQSTGHPPFNRSGSQQTSPLSHQSSAFQPREGYPQQPGYPQHPGYPQQPGYPQYPGYTTIVHPRYPGTFLHPTTQQPLGYRQVFIQGYPQHNFQQPHTSVPDRSGLGRGAAVGLAALAGLLLGCIIL